MVGILVQLWAEHLPASFKFLHRVLIDMSIEFPEADYTLTREGELWVALHVETGIASQGESPTEAVEMADDAVELHQQDHDLGDEEFQKEMLDRYYIV